MRRAGRWCSNLESPVLGLLIVGDDQKVHCPHEGAVRCYVNAEFLRYVWKDNVDTNPQGAAPIFVNDLDVAYVTVDFAFGFLMKIHVTLIPGCGGNSDRKPSRRAGAWKALAICRKAWAGAHYGHVLCV
jgi:hypothetical protein